jgi:Zn-dependent protease
MEPTSPFAPLEPSPPLGSLEPRPPFVSAPTAPEPAGSGSPFEQRRSPWWRRRLGAAGAAIIALLAKLKAVLLLLPKVKLLATAGTMIVSVIAYGSIWGFAFAAGFVALILIHEMGHVIQLRREGIRASAPIFIPFLGAVIGSRSLGDNALAEARVGLAGPILGTVGAAACLAVWQLTGNDLWRALAFTGFFLNLFNLIPMVPLDGGRAMAAMTPWMWGAGFAGLVVLAFFFPNPIFVLILIVGGYETYRRWKQSRRDGPQGAGYYKVSPRNRALVAAVYLGLIALLVLGMQLANLPRTIL